MKALLITAIASFFALSVSAQVSTDTKVGSTTATGTKQMGAARPAKVATSTTPTFQNASGTDATPKTKDANRQPVETTAPATTKKAPEGVTKEVKADNPGSQKLSTGRRDTNVPAVKDEAPKE
jgi:hypothetical protein